MYCCGLRICLAIGEHPGIKREKIQKLADVILNYDDIEKMLEELAGENNLTNISVYGIGTIGRLLIQLLKEKIHISAIYDAYASINDYNGVMVKKVSESKNQQGIMFVTAYGNFSQISESIRACGYDGRIINMYNLLS